MEKSIAGSVPPGTKPASPAMAESPEQSQKRILDFLESRIRKNGDFPALSEAISHINRIASSEKESITTLSNAILREFALTTKLLKLVNSVSYVQYGGGNVGTVSRAVSILGFDAVKNIAMTLILFEHLQNKKQAAQLKNEYLRTLFSGTLALEFSLKTLASSPEEAYICAMFHNLGRLLGMFYFPEEAEAVRRIMAEKKIGEEAASLLALGVSYRELGMAVADEWCFPEHIVKSMAALPLGPVKKSSGGADTLQMLATLSNELCEVLDRVSGDDMPGEVRKILKRYDEALPLTETHVTFAIEKAMNDVAQYADAIQINLRKIPFGSRISQAGGDGAAPEPNGAPAIHTVPGKEAEHLAAKKPERDTHVVLADCIREISDCLVEEKPLNDIMHVILETLYQGLGFSHVMLFTVSNDNKSLMKARFGYGIGAEAIIPAFHFVIAGGGDVFQAAVAGGTEIVVADIDDPHVQKRIPDWYRRATRSKTFALYPLNVRNKPVALIYADKEQPGEIRLDRLEQSLLHTLRNQALLAIKRSL